MKTLTEEQINKLSLKRLRAYHKSIMIAENVINCKKEGFYWGFRIDQEEYDRQMNAIAPIKKLVMKALYNYRTK